MSQQFKPKETAVIQSVLPMVKPAGQVTNDSAAKDHLFSNYRLVPALNHHRSRFAGLVGAHLQINNTGGKKQNGF